VPIDQMMLRDRALLAARRAYAPYSGMFVGAAVATRDDRVVTGANVENSSYGLTICAERAAVFTAVASADEGTDLRSYITDVVAIDSRGNVLAPCGACRQVIMEFGAHARVLLPSGKRVPTGDLLLEGFSMPRSRQKEVRRPFVAGRDRDQIVQLLGRLTQETLTVSSELNQDQVRSCVFLPDGDELSIPPGLHYNFENTIELSIRLPPDQGITGRAFAHGHEPNSGSPGKVGNLPGEPIEASENRKVSDGLFWIVAWPLRVPQASRDDPAIGVVSLDGFDQISAPTLNTIKDSPILDARVQQIARALHRAIS
jgi:cytidine deaminase